jgi:hypothetical protein
MILVLIVIVPRHVPRSSEPVDPGAFLAGVIALWSFGF